MNLCIFYKFQNCSSLVICYFVVFWRYVRLSFFIHLSLHSINHNDHIRYNFILWHVRALTWDILLHVLLIKFGNWGQNILLAPAQILPRNPESSVRVWDFRIFSRFNSFQILYVSSYYVFLKLSIPHVLNCAVFFDWFVIFAWFDCILIMMNFICHKLE